MALKSSVEKTLNPAQENGLRDRNTSYNLTAVRSVSPIFGIMEQQSGPSGWNFRIIHATPKPGRLRLWTLQAIAHGAAFAEDTAKHFIERERLHAPLETESFFELPEEIELAIRGDYIILLNYGETPVTFTCDVPFTDLITGTCFEHEIMINQTDVVVFHLPD